MRVPSQKHRLSWRLLALLLHWLKPALSQLRLGAYVRQPYVDDKICPSPMFELGETSPLLCLAECYAISGCFTVAIHAGDGKCWGCGLCNPDATQLPGKAGARFWSAKNTFVAFGHYGVEKSQFSQSSSKGHDEQYMAYQGNPRVSVWRYGTTTWGTDVTDGQQFVQVDFRRAQTVTHVVTQSHNHWRWPGRVEEYRFLYSDDCVDFQYVTDPATGNPVLFPGNTDWTRTVFNRLSRPITSRCFRINPTRWSRLEMRFDLKGCPYYT